MAKLFALGLGAVVGIESPQVPFVDGRSDLVAHPVLVAGAAGLRLECRSIPPVGVAVDLAQLLQGLLTFGVG